MLGELCARRPHLRGVLGTIPLILRRSVHQIAIETPVSDLMTKVAGVRQQWQKVECVRLMGKWNGYASKECSSKTGREQVARADWKEVAALNRWSRLSIVYSVLGTVRVWPRDKDRSRGG